MRQIPVRGGVELTTVKPSRRMPTVIPDTWVLPRLIALSVTVKVDPIFTVEADAASAPVKSPLAAWADGAADNNPAPASATTAASRAARMPSQAPRDPVLPAVSPIVLPLPVRVVAPRIPRSRSRVPVRGALTAMAGRCAIPPDICYGTSGFHPEEHDAARSRAPRAAGRPHNTDTSGSAGRLWGRGATTRPAHLPLRGVRRQGTWPLRSPLPVLAGAGCFLAGYA